MYGSAVVSPLPLLRRGNERRDTRFKTSRSTSWKARNPFGDGAPAVAACAAHEHGRYGHAAFSLNERGRQRTANSWFWRHSLRRATLSKAVREAWLPESAARGRSLEGNLRGRQRVPAMGTLSGRKAGHRRRSHRREARQRGTTPHKTRTRERAQPSAVLKGPPDPESLLVSVLRRGRRTGRQRSRHRTSGDGERPISLRVGEQLLCSGP